MLTNQQSFEDRPLLIIGAGPIGLATAAKCAAAGVDFTLVEAGRGCASSVRDWSHVRLFSPWSECIDEDASGLLQAAGWRPPPLADFPTGGELIHAYLRPLARLPEIVARSAYRRKVAHIGRAQGGFCATTTRGCKVLGSAVIDASGTWATPRTLQRAAGGRPRRIFHRVPDVGQKPVRQMLAGRRVAIIGSGHSGMTLLLQLEEVIGAGQLLWIRRGAVVHSGAPIGPGSARLGLEQRAERAAARTGVSVLEGATITELRETATSVEVTGHIDQGSAFSFKADYVFAALGFDPDHAMARDLRLDLDPELGAPAALAHLIDPRKHSCNSVPAHGWRELAHPEPGYFILGSKSYGRAPNFALSTGYRQVDSVLAHLAPGKFAAKAGSGDCSPCVKQCA